MKTKILLALAMSLSTVSAFANSMELPKGLVERHAAICPDFIERNLYVDIQKLPANPGAPASTIYVMGCELYAYNSMEKAYVVNSYGEISSVEVADFGPEGLLFGTSDLMGAAFNPATGTLETSSRGRGMGDCGSSAVYKWNTTYQKFSLEEARLKDECDGEYGEWPVVYKK